jgi:hypothetical protein
MRARRREIGLALNGAAEKVLGLYFMPLKDAHDPEQIEGTILVRRSAQNGLKIAFSACEFSSSNSLSRVLQP